MHHNLKLKIINSKKLRQRQISQYFLASSQFKKVLVTYVRNEVEALEAFDCLDGPIYVKGISSRLLWDAWKDIQNQNQMPGWIASRFEDGQFWASRWELHYLDMLGDFYPEINEQIGLNCAGVFYLFSLVNRSLLLQCMPETNIPGADDKTL